MKKSTGFHPPAQLGFPSSQWSARFRRSGGSAERRILLVYFSDGGFLPKAAMVGQCVVQPR